MDDQNKSNLYLDVEDMGRRSSMSLFFLKSQKCIFMGPSAREFGAYRISEERRLGRACIRDIHVCDMDADEGGFRTNIKDL